MYDFLYHSYSEIQHTTLFEHKWVNTTKRHLSFNTRWQNRDHLEVSLNLATFLDNYSVCVTYQFNNIHKQNYAKRIKDTQWVLRHDEPLVHVFVDISLITKHILDHDVSLES